MSTVIEIKGGLGNQLFQYAYGLYLKRRGAEVSYNIRWFDKKVPGRDYLLDQLYFDISLTDKTPTEKGYYEELRFTEPVKDKLMLPHGNIDAVAVHIRRGDTVGHPRYVDLSLDYYKDLINLYQGKEIYVFSDDIPWCKEHLHGYTYIDKDVITSFNLMRSCRVKIIANSTFSWWAAYLSIHKEVLVPDTWRTYTTTYQDKLMYSKWKRYKSRSVQKPYKEACQKSP